VPQYRTWKLTSPHYSTSSLFHHHSYYIVTLLLAMVLLTLPSSSYAQRVQMPCQHGNTAMKECIVPFSSHSVSLPTPEEVGLHIKYVQMMLAVQTREKLCGKCGGFAFHVCKHQSSLLQYRFTSLPLSPIFSRT
jgi:hypothetical protein